MQLIQSVGWLGLTVLLSGCATTGYQRTSRTRSAIDEARASVATVQQEVGAATHALQQLTLPDVTDLRPPYENFSVTVKGLELQAARLANCGRAVQATSDAYIKTWQQELAAYSSGAIRARSAERRGVVIENFRLMNDQFHVATDSLRPLLVDLKDLQRFLSTDLTMAGATSAQELAGRVTAQAQDVQKHLQTLLVDLERVSTELSPVKPTPEPPAPAAAN